MLQQQINNLFRIVIKTPDQNSSASKAFVLIGGAEDVWRVWYELKDRFSIEIFGMDGYIFNPASGITSLVGFNE